ncbi:cytochrome P450 [Gloeopeniophorella convolvens]|nr:cytochrome P450 [Gloeopeniophorella convolvens]
MKAAFIGSTTTVPGSVLVNHIPILRHIPAWLPWLSYKPLAREGFEIGQDLIHTPYAFVKKEMEAGTARPSLALESLQELEKLHGPKREETQTARAETLGSLYLAGADTTVSALSALFCVVAMYPDLQRRAQEELDAVTGGERLPDYDDRSRLPFVDAICKELLRWKPVVPLGIPHTPIEDDVYRGWIIPKGSIVIANAWAILHDPEVFPDPDAFKPERFLAADGSVREDLPVTPAFGFGKRICPGRYFVDATLFIVVASVLSVFDISKAKEENGDEIPVDGTFEGRALSHPLPFRCAITPRTQQAIDLIHATED